MLFCWVSNGFVLGLCFKIILEKKVSGGVLGGGKKIVLSGLWVGRFCYNVFMFLGLGGFGEYKG